ncbi:nuclear transport factor 2 family protein [Phenylobacterium sp.]|uniref:nuclear transport factor 2 family protein n=1 Tax=Phenylobacterium sp. TaxID=1871053 RepID=UPI0025F4597D|nr:nuclear transport factor 2 family protein [Phenylobacterium sp.]
MPRADEIDAAELREVIAKQKIADVLARYSRGIDRCDIETLLAVFWPEATADYGSGPQNAHQWARATVAALRGMRRTQHALSNMLIEVDGDRARAETYCQAFHELDGDDGGLEMVVGGRYLDLLERRDGAWRVSHRTYVMDWNRNTVSTCRWDDGLYTGLKIRGGRWPDDPLQVFLRGGQAR